jgi:hypothetical protein
MQDQYRVFPGILYKKSGKSIEWLVFIIIHHPSHNIHVNVRLQPQRQLLILLAERVRTFFKKAVCNSTKTGILSAMKLFLQLIPPRFLALNWQIPPVVPRINPMNAT